MPIHLAHVLQKAYMIFNSISSAVDNTFYQWRRSLFTYLTLMTEIHLFKGNNLLKQGFPRFGAGVRQLPPTHQLSEAKVFFLQIRADEREGADEKNDKKMTKEGGRAAKKVMSLT